MVDVSLYVRKVPGLTLLFYDYDVSWLFLVSDHILLMIKGGSVVGKILWLGVSLLKPHKAGCMPLFGDVFLQTGTGTDTAEDTEDDLTSSLSFLTIYHVLWKTSLCRFWLFSHISCLRKTPLGIRPGFLNVQPVPFWAPMMLCKLWRDSN